MNSSLLLLSLLVILTSPQVYGQKSQKTSKTSKPQSDSKKTSDAPSTPSSSGSGSYPEVISLYAKNMERKWLLLASSCVKEVGGHEMRQGQRRDYCIGFSDPGVVGKFFPDLGLCFFLRDGVEESQRSCKYVLPSNGFVQWMGAKASAVPKNIVPMKAGSDLHACRILYQGDLVVGTWKKGSSECVAGHNGEEISSDVFEIRVRTRLGVFLEKVRPNLPV